MGTTTQRIVVRTTVAAFLYGALVYGGVLAVAHLLYNRVAVVADALVVLVTFMALYGLGGAAVGAACALVAVATVRLRTRAAPGMRSDLTAPAVVLAVTAVNLLFWIPLATYGVTYDEIPFGAAAGVGGMILVLVGRALAVVGAAIAVALLARRVARAHPPLGRLAAGACLALVVVAVVATLAMRGGALADSVVDGAPVAIERVDTGYKVMVIGLDGADWRVIRPLVAAGALPTFARLMREGSSGPLETLAGANSAVMWASVYTGRRPAGHGIRDFYRVALPGLTGPGLFPVHRSFFIEIGAALERLGLGERRVVDRHQLGAPPLWEIADAAGVSIGVIDNYLFAYPLFTPTQPASFFVAYGFGYLREDTMPLAKDYAAPPELASQLVPLVARGDLYWQTAALLRLLGERPQPDLVSLYTHEPDSRQHLFWKWHEPQLYLDAHPADVVRFADVIPSVYRDIDAFLGELLARVDERTIFVVLSDHGHSPTLLKHGSHTEHRHGPPGILIMHGGSVRAGASLGDAHLYDVFPTVLHLLGLPVPQKAAGEVLTAAFTDDFVAQRPIRTITSYQWVGASTSTGPTGRQEQWNAEQIEKLRALGYVR